MPDCISKAAIIGLVLSFTCHLCDAQERASGNPPKSEKPPQSPTPNPLSPRPVTDIPGRARRSPDFDPLAPQGRPGPPVPVTKTDEERRQAIDKRTQEYAAEAVKELQKGFFPHQSSADRFPLFSSPEMQKLLGDEKTDDKLRSLRKRRAQTALAECVARMAEYQAGISQITKALESAQRFASSLLDLEPDSKTRLIILRQNLAIAQDLEKFADISREHGGGRSSDLALATYERIDAEIRLLQEEMRQQEQKSKVAE